MVYNIQVIYYVEILRLSAKLRILKWGSDNLKNGEILSLAPTAITPGFSTISWNLENLQICIIHH